MTTMTGFKAAKLINAELESANIKSIPPQMVYNYMKKGYLPTVDVNGQKLVEESAISEWVQTYIEKKQAKLLEVMVEETHV